MRLCRSTTLPEPGYIAATCVQKFTDQRIVAVDLEQQIYFFILHRQNNVMKELIETFQIHNRINLYLLDAIEEAHLEDRMKVESR
ncbi:MAG TPA: hypothetical protein VMI12_09170 [Puia sp.]|nr:hypothetical protein [Puia sp.]